MLIHPCTLEFGSIGEGPHLYLMARGEWSDPIQAASGY